MRDFKEVFSESDGGVFCLRPSAVTGYRIECDPNAGPHKFAVKLYANAQMYALDPTGTDGYAFDSAEQARKELAKFFGEDS